MRLIESKTLGTAQAAIEFTSIPNTFTDLVLVYSLRDTGTNGTERVHNTVITFNGTSTGITIRSLAGSGSSAFVFTSPANWGGWHPDAGATSSTFGNSALYIPNYAGSTNKSFSIDNVTENNATLSYQAIVAGLWSNTAAITTVTLTTLGASYAVGSMASLYGILKGSDGIVTTS